MRNLQWSYQVIVNTTYWWVMLTVPFPAVPSCSTLLYCVSYVSFPILNNACLTFTIVLSGSIDSSIRCWDCRSRKPEAIQILDEAKDGISSIKISDHEILAGWVFFFFCCHPVIGGTYPMSHSFPCLSHSVAEGMDLVSQSSFYLCHSVVGWVAFTLLFVSILSVSPCRSHKYCKYVPVVSLSSCIQTPVMGTPTVLHSQDIQRLFSFCLLQVCRWTLASVWPS